MEDGVGENKRVMRNLLDGMRINREGDRSMTGTSEFRCVRPSLCFALNMPLTPFSDPSSGPVRAKPTVPRDSTVANYPFQIAMGLIWVKMESTQASV